MHCRTECIVKWSTHWQWGFHTWLEISFAWDFVCLGVHFLLNTYQLFWLLYCGKKLYVTNTAPAMKMRTPQVVQTRTSITPCECQSEKCWSKHGGRALKIRTVPKTAACASLAVKDGSRVRVCKIA